MLIEILLALLILALSIASLFPMIESAIRFSPKARLNSKPLSSICQEAGRRSNISLIECKSSEQLKLILKDSGFSLMELLISTSIGLLLIVTVCKAYAVVIHHHKVIAERIKENQVSARAESEVARIFRLSDRHALPILSRIHKSGQILLKSGDFNAVMKSKFSPDINSDALTNVSLEFQTLADITECRARGFSRSGNACLRYSNSAATSDYKSFAIISIDGQFEGVGSFSGSGRCKNFSLELSASMVFDEPIKSNVCNERVLIPINFIQTIYYAESSDFRLISHRGNLNVENQPLTSSLPQVILKLSESNSSLHLEIRRKEQIITERLVNATLGRLAIENYLINKL